MTRTRPSGACHICGEIGPLSFEHIPPRAAFNDRQVIMAKFEQVINLGPDEPVRGRIQQKGLGGYTLCERCNNKTGHWYGNQFVDWCYQGMDLVEKSRGHPSLFYIYHIFPLAILKQIIAMFLSINRLETRQHQPDLVKFVLNKEARYLAPKYQIFVYYNVVGHLRTLDLRARIDTQSAKTDFLSEITFPPFGYVLTIDTGIPDDRLIEISHFARYDYRELCDIELKLAALPTHLPTMAADYRTKEQILRDRERNGRQVLIPIRDAS